MSETIANLGGDAPDAIDISVVIGRVSTEDSDRILETIAAFDQDTGSLRYEIVIVDRLADALSHAIATRYPHVAHIPCAAGLSLPEMRTIAFEASRGAIVAVTEDHCVPASGWLRLVHDAFEQGGDTVVAVGGSVVNGVTDTGFDWATFLCEYSFFSPPVDEGATAVLPGMNVAYRRRVLEDVPRSMLTSGFWETTLHRKLLDEGGRFVSRNDIRMYHCKRFSMSLFARQRFIYSHYYAGLRYGGAGIARRVAAALASLALPPLLLYRMRTASKRKGLAREFGSALPSLAMLVVVWALGESFGALAGPGDALARIE